MIHTIDYAEKHGYSALTRPYADSDTELRWRRAVEADMQRGEVDYIIVRELNGTSVWRKGIIKAGRRLDPHLREYLRQRDGEAA